MPGHYIGFIPLLVQIHRQIEMQIDHSRTMKPVDPIWALAQQRAIPVEQPLGETLPGLVTTWLYDPDQVTNYFAEIRPRPRPAAAQPPATTR